MPGQVCCKIYQHDVHSLAAGMATRAWVQLVEKATFAGVLSGDYSRGISPVTRSFKQQLLDSGLLQQLPVLFSAAAEHLDAAPALVADDGSSSAAAHSSSSGWGILNDPLALERDVVVLGYGFESLRDRFPSAQQPVQAEFDKIVGAACILPGARLCVAVLQHPSRRLGPMQVPLACVAERKVLSCIVLKGLPCQTCAWPASLQPCCFPLLQLQHMKVSVLLQHSTRNCQRSLCTAPALPR